MLILGGILLLFLLLFLFCSLKVASRCDEIEENHFSIGKNEKM